MEFRYERYQALDRVAWINYQAKGIQATKMIRGFLRLLLIVSAVAALAAENSAVPETARPASSTAPPASLTARPASVRDGQHDFDWEFGKWHTHLWRLKQPLSGSNEWVEYRWHDSGAKNLGRTRQSGGTGGRWTQSHRGIESASV